MKLKDLFEELGLELTKETESLLISNVDTILIPSKTEAKLKYISKKDLQTIHEDINIAKELILIILSNFSDTFYKATTNYATEAQKVGYKVLNATIMKEQVDISKKLKSPYLTILEILIKYNIIEAGRRYSKGIRSNEYRLTDTFFKKGVVTYELKSSVLRKKHNKKVEENLRKVLSCPIAYNELLNRSLLQFPSQDEAKEHLIKLAKEGKTNKRGKKIVFLNKRASEDFENCVFIEDYLKILDYLQKITIPIIISDNGGNRVITAFNFIPSVLRPLITVNGTSLSEADYSCLHPNICQFIYGGSNTSMITHDIVSEYLGVDRSVAKLGHLSFFNLPYDKMYHSPLFKYYADNEPKMMENIYHIKNEKGYKATSKDCFIFETELMRENIKEIKEEGITVFYAFDALYCLPKDIERVKEIMNNNSDKFGLLTKTN